VNLLFALLFLASSTWTETWASGTANWTDSNGVAFTCSTAGNVLHATRGCNQQAFSIMRWDQTQAVNVSGTVRGQPVGTTPYFCGLALLQNQNVYAQAAVGRDVQPVPLNGTPQLIWWNDEYPNRASRYYYLGATSVDAWQAFSVTWTPTKAGSGWWSATVNGIDQHRIKDTVTAPLLVDLQGAPLYDDGSECQFGAITVVGVRL
jgi:hypothetical protein